MRIRRRTCESCAHFDLERRKKSTFGWSDCLWGRGDYDYDHFYFYSRVTLHAEIQNRWRRTLMWLLLRGMPLGTNLVYEPDRLITAPTKRHRCPTWKKRKEP